MESDLLAFVIEQRTYGQGSEDEPSACTKAMVPFWLGRQSGKRSDKVGQNGAEHGGDHPVDKDGEQMAARINTQ